jgi:hypothetical protein
VLGTDPDTARKTVFEARNALSADRAARDEDCAAIRQTLSDGDGRRRRARRVRSHLRGCASCREWDRTQRERRRRLAALPLGGLSAGGSLWGWLAGVLGGGSTATAGLPTAMTANVKVVAAVTVLAAGTAPVIRHESAPSQAHNVAAAPKSAQTRQAPGTSWVARSPRDPLPGCEPGWPAVGKARSGGARAREGERAGHRDRHQRSDGSDHRCLLPLWNRSERSRPGGPASTLRGQLRKGGRDVGTYLRRACSSHSTAPRDPVTGDGAASIRRHPEASSPRAACSTAARTCPWAGGAPSASSC